MALLANHRSVWSTTIQEKKKLNFSQAFLIYFGLSQYVPVFYGLIKAGVSCENKLKLMSKLQN